MGIGNNAARNMFWVLAFNFFGIHADELLGHMVIQFLIEELPQWPPFLHLHNSGVCSSVCVLNIYINLNTVDEHGVVKKKYRYTCKKWCGEGTKLY